MHSLLLILLVRVLVMVDDRVALSNLATRPAAYGTAHNLPGNVFALAVSFLDILRHSSSFVSCARAVHVFLADTDRLHSFEDIVRVVEFHAVEDLHLSLLVLLCYHAPVLLITDLGKLVPCRTLLLTAAADHLWLR